MSLQICELSLIVSAPFDLPELGAYVHDYFQALDGYAVVSPRLVDFAVDAYSVEHIYGVVRVRVMLDIAGKAPALAWTNAMMSNLANTAPLEELTGFSVTWKESIDSVEGHAINDYMRNAQELDLLGVELIIERQLELGANNVAFQVELAKRGCGLFSDEYFRLIDEFVTRRAAA